MAAGAANRVLVIDDEEPIRSTVVALLASAGISATGFGTAGEALENGDATRAAVALIDYRLPDMSGLDLAVGLNSKNPDLRVILMTGHASIESAIESVGRVDEYLIKPVQPPTLLRSVRNAIERHALLIENRSLVERLQRLTSYQALYDPLTGLPNRVLLTDHLHEVLETSRREHGVGVLFVDLDDFKVINDTLGHSVGDLLLRQVAERIDDESAPEVTVARFGGDKFVVVHTDVVSEADAAAAAQRLLDRFAEPFVVGEVSHRINASIGVAVATSGDGTNPDVLLRNADTAMYGAKRNGRSQWAVFDASMHDRVLQRYDIERGLREALDQGHLDLAYQPIVELSTGQVVGAEALLRWNRPGAGVIRPDDFLPVADEAGLCPSIGTWVIERALDDLASWRRSGAAPEGFRLWINAFPSQAADPALPDQMAGGLARRDLPAAAIGIEIIEEALADLGVTIEVLSALRQTGVGVSLDDFGAGHSNLAWLQDLPITGLKIDRRFINDLDRVGDRKGTLIVRGLIGLGDALELELLAEGVERPTQATMLEEMGCALAQGFYFGYPGPAEQLWQPPVTPGSPRPGPT